MMSVMKEKLLEEFLVDVLIDGHKEQLKVFSDSLVSTIDTIVSFESVEELLNIKRERDQRSWNFAKNKEGFNRLREIRKEIGDEGVIRRGLDDLVNDELQDSSTNASNAVVKGTD